jgi:glycine/serine hydroxymethyltransferase
MGKDEMIQISHLMRETLQNPENTIEIQQKIKDLAARFYSVQYSFDF